jgi:hypothetical protein
MLTRPAAYTGKGGLREASIPFPPFPPLPASSRGGGSEGGQEVDRQMNQPGRAGRLMRRGAGVGAGVWWLAGDVTPADPAARDWRADGASLLRAGQVSGCSLLCCCGSEAAQVSGCRPSLPRQTESPSLPRQTRSPTGSPGAHVWAGGWVGADQVAAARGGEGPAGGWEARRLAAPRQPDGHPAGPARTRTHARARARVHTHTHTHIDARTRRARPRPRGILQAMPRHDMGPCRPPGDAPRPSYATWAHAVQDGRGILRP